MTSRAFISHVSPVELQAMMRDFAFYDDAGDVIETHEHAGEFKEW